MQQMQGNMRGFGMGGQQYRQFFAAGTRSSLLGPVPMGVAIKSPMMGFPPARPVYPPVRYFNNSPGVPGTSSASTSTMDAAAHLSDRKRSSEPLTQESSDDQPGPSTAIEAIELSEAGNVLDKADESNTSEEQHEEPVTKKQRTHGLEEPIEQPVVSVAESDAVILCSESDSQPGDEGSSAVGSEVLELDEECMAAEVQGSLLPSVEDQHVDMPSVKEPQEHDDLLPTEHQEEEEGVEEGTNKFYCYLCSITCHNQQNFRSHMNSISHQQRMMEIQHMSNACLVSLLPRIQDSLQGPNKDDQKKAETQRWCAICQTHFTSSIMEHRQTREHKLARKMAISSCTICKKHFRSSQIFVEHLQTLEHKKKLQEIEICDELVKVTDCFFVEEEGSVMEEAEGLSNAEDQDDTDRQDDCTPREVSLKDLDDSEQYDPETVYSSNFLVPVAGFICRLCNKFYHFESSELHLHCKSLKHFENLKRYKTVQKDEAEKTSMKCAAEDKPEEESVEDFSESNSKHPIISLCRVQMQKEQEEEPNKTLQDLNILAPSTSCTDQELLGGEEGTTSNTVEVEDSVTVTADSEQTISAEEKKDLDKKEVKGKTSSKSSKDNPAPRRRTSRATNKR